MGSFFKACLKFTKKVMINIPLNKTLNLIPYKMGCSRTISDTLSYSITHFESRQI